MTAPLVSVVILNFNGAGWLPRCLGSLAGQTIVQSLQIIVADNASTDGSDKQAAQFLESLPTAGFLLQNGGNLGYCEGNNRGAKRATGKYLLFLNADTWLERDCIETLVLTTEKDNADCGSPMVLNYDDDTFQGNGANGFDWFGYLTAPRRALPAGRIFAAPGCSLLVKREVFDRIGGFDREFFMYADEADLAWRLVLSGALAISVPKARVHHRGAVAANPKGGEKVVEFRTNEMVRFLATRNSFLVILKNAQHALLLLCLMQSLWVFLEVLAVLVATRQWGPVRRAYLRAFKEIWNMRQHIRTERRRISLIRKKGDIWMLRFLRLRPGRWVDVEKLFRLGPPKVSPSKF